MSRKLRKYEIVDGGGRCSMCFVIREVGNPRSSGWIASSWGLSKADRKAVEQLVRQANEAWEKEAQNGIH